MRGIGPLRAVALSSIFLVPGANAVARQTTARNTAPACDVALPALQAGAHLLPWLTLTQHPPDADWRETAYRPATPRVLAIEDAQVFGAAGLIAIGDEIVEDTLGRAEPGRDRFRREAAGVTLFPRATLPAIAGPALSLLGPGWDSPYHWTVDGIGRLAAADQAALAGITDLLLPAGLGPLQRHLLARARLPAHLRLHELAPGDLLHVRRLVLPWSIESDFMRGGNHHPHPCLRRYFVPFAAAAPPGPRRIYIDRRQSPARRLLNEAEVIDALARFGFTPVALEYLPPPEQLALFAHAAAIVAPHGAGLAHLLHARPGTRLLELHAAHWTNWCYRRHAAAAGLRYDAIAGPAATGRDTDPVNLRAWTLSITHLQAAVATLLD